MTVMRPFCLVKPCTLDAAAMRVRSLFTLLTFCKTIFSCSLILKERIYIVPFTCVSLIPATIPVLFYLENKENLSNLNTTDALPMKEFFYDAQNCQNSLKKSYFQISKNVWQPFLRSGTLIRSCQVKMVANISTRSSQLIHYKCHGRFSFRLEDLVVSH